LTLSALLGTWKCSNVPHAPNDRFTYVFGRDGNGSKIMNYGAYRFKYWLKDTLVYMKSPTAALVRERITVQGNVLIDDGYEWLSADGRWIPPPPGFYQSRCTRVR
jgi:hypothetical protein